MSNSISSFEASSAYGRASNSSLGSAIGRFCRKLSSKKKEAPPPSPPQEDERDSSSEGEFEEDDGGRDNYSSELRKVFRYIDEDGDGRISPKELRSCVGLVGGEEGGLSEEEAEMAVRSSDSDGDGLLGFEDFERMMEKPETEEERRKEIEEAFDMYKMEGTGCITPASLKRMLGRLGQSSTTESCKAMIRAYDLNGDGVLSLDEFCVMMR